MLRITRLGTDQGPHCLRVEGRLVGDWVHLLEREVSIASGDGTLALDLSGVDYADAPGLGLLRRLSARGIELSACSPFLFALLGRSEP